MDQEVKESIAISVITKSKIKVIDNNSEIKITIPPKGFKGGAMITFIVIVLWMFTIAIWSVLLVMMKPINIMYSIPFWAIGFWTFFKALKMMRLKELLILDEKEITLQRTTAKLEERSFNNEEITVSLVEGGYYSYSGLLKRGHFPAILCNEEAFGFGERLSREEKIWLVNFLNKKLKEFKNA